MKRSVLLGFILTGILGKTYAINMAYVEVNSNQLHNVSCYVRSDNNKSYFDMVSIFAGNINGQSPNKPEIFFNDNVNAVLHSDQIKSLQNKGIKVLLTLLGNHQNAGWACMTDAVSAQKFADDVVKMVNRYHLDGIDIDDEYSNCKTNNYSMIMIAQAIKSHPEFSGKLLTKPLFHDANYFSETYQGHKLSEYLDYGWEMSYTAINFDSRLAVYRENGMAMNKLMLGGWPIKKYPDPIEIGKYTLKNNLAGVMVYDVTNHSASYLTQMLKAENDSLQIITLANCLK